MEWDYGQYDGLTTAEIRKENPDWSLFRDGCPGRRVGRGGRSPGRPRHRPAAGDRRPRLLFGHGHFFRVLAARWLGLPPSDGRLFYLSTASLSMLGYEHSRDEPVIRLWNDDRHVTS